MSNASFKRRIEKINKEHFSDIFIYPQLLGVIQLMFELWALTDIFFRTKHFS